MSGLTLVRRLAPTLLLGIAYGAPGCSAEPAAEKVPTGEMVAEAPAHATPVVMNRPAPAVTALSIPAADARLTVEGEGLRWFFQPSGSARPIPFGRPQSEVLASLEVMQGPAE